MDSRTSSRDAKKEVEKDSGIAGNKRGIDYHYYVAMCLCLEGHRHKQDNPKYEYRLHQEDKEAGMFDDLVYEYRNNQCEPWTRLLIQIKNKKSNNKIKTSNLLFNDKKETYSLLKFYKSFKEIKNTKNCIFIIYTNASFELDENGHLRKWYKKESGKETNLLPSKAFYIPILDKGSQYKFNEEINVDIFFEHTNIVKEEWKQFFTKLIFAVDQPDLEEIKSVVNNKIEEILPKSTEKIRCGLMDKLDDSLFNKKEISSREISDLIENAQKDIEIFHANKYEDGVLDFEFNIPLYEFFISNKTLLAIKSNNSEICLHKVCKMIKKLRQKKSDVNKYTMKHVYSIKQMIDIETDIKFNLLIICVKSSDQLKKIIPKNDDQKYIIVVPNNMKLLEIHNYYQVCEDNEKTFKVLTASSKQYILEEKCVLFNEKKSSFSDILNVNSSVLTENQVEELTNVITDGVIQCFLNQDYAGLKISFNNKYINTLGVYIKRKLYSSAVIEESKINEFKELCIVDNLHNFKTNCEKNPGQSIHHFKKQNKHLTWTQSNGDLTKLRYFIKENRVQTLLEEELTDFVIDEDELCHLNNNAILISDKPGKGKSTLSSSVFNKLQSKYPTNIILRLNLNDHTKAFEENTILNSPQTAIDFLKNKLLAEAKPSVISNNLLNFTIQNKNKVFVLLDGVDEVYPEYKNTVFKFIQSLRELKFISLFLTTRPTETDSLEKLLKTFALSILPFTKQDQISYLNLVLKSKNVDTESVLEKINKEPELQEICGVPLLLRIVAEIIIDNTDEDFNIEEILNLSKIFNTFVNQKFKIYSNEKKKQDTTNASVKGDDEELQISYKKKHEYLAMHFLFNEYENKKTLDEKTIDRIIKVGLVTQIKDKKADFIHRTFAEFFASTFIETHFNEERVIRILFTKVFIENDLTVLRKFINNYIKDKPSDYDTKEKYKLFINNNYSNIFDRIPILREIFKSVDNNDPLLSILFTATIENNSETAIFISQCFENKPNILNKMYLYESDNYKLVKRLKTAISRGNTANVKQLMNYCFKNNINKKTAIFQYVFGKGDNNGVTALHSAAITGHTDILNTLLDKGVHINIANNDGFTALHSAALEGHTDTVNALLGRGTGVNIATKDGFIALHCAAYKGHAVTVNALLRTGADVNKANNDGSTALHFAAQQGYTDTVNKLLNAGADVNTCENDGLTALYAAAQTGHTDTVRVLLGVGADVNITNNNGFTALYIAAQQGHTDIAKEILNKDADVNIINNGFTALYIAAQQGHTDTVNALLNRDADMNIATYVGYVALQVAAQQGHTGTVVALLRKGADVNMSDRDGDTPLHLVALKGHTDTVKALINRGADVNIVNNNGHIALQIAAQQGHTDTVLALLGKSASVNIATNFVHTALHTAAQAGHTDIVRVLLGVGADVNITNNNGFTALYIAAQQGHTDTVIALLDRGADVNIASNVGHTALHIAAQAGHTDIVLALLDRGADVNSGDRDGDTPLHLVVVERHTDTMHVLLDRGADINKASIHGFTAMHWATLYSCAVSIRMLLNRGADINISNAYGERALQLAYRTNNYKLVQILLRHGNSLYDHNDSDSDSGSGCNEDSDFITNLYNALKLLMKHRNDLCDHSGSGSDLITKLHIAVWRRNVYDVKSWLNKCDINASDSHDRTPLYWAALFGECDIMKALLSGGADVNIRDINNSTVLQAAFRSGNYRAVQLLLRHNNNELYNYYNSDNE